MSGCPFHVIAFTWSQKHHSAQRAEFFTQGAALFSPSAQPIFHPEPQAQFSSVAVYVSTLEADIVLGA